MVGLFETEEEVKLYSFIAERVNIRVCTYLNMFFTSGGLSRYCECLDSAPEKSVWVLR